MGVLMLPEGVIDILERHLRPVEGEQTQVIPVVIGSARVAIVSTPPLSTQQAAQLADALHGKTLPEQSIDQADERRRRRAYLAFSAYTDATTAYGYFSPETLEEIWRGMSPAAREPWLRVADAMG